MARTRKTPPKLAVDYHVWYTNGRDYMMTLPKMPKSKAEAIMRMDAKSDGTELKGYRILNAKSA